MKEPPDFLACMIDADRSLTALQAVRSRRNILAIRKAVADAALVQKRLAVLWDSQAFPAGDSIRLQLVRDRLHASLKYFRRRIY